MGDGDVKVVSGEALKTAQHVDPVMEKPWQRAKRFERYDNWRKSRYPPMFIQPMPTERERLYGEGMTAEDRALRKQWVQDQVLKYEKRMVPALQPKNIFRRIYRWPADTFIEKPLKGLIGSHHAANVRWGLPKIFFFFAAWSYTWYWLKYNSLEWTKVRGPWQIFPKEAVFDQDAPEPETPDFHDRGFKDRKVLRDYKDPHHI